MNKLLPKINIAFLFLLFSFLPHAQASNWFGVKTGSPLNLSTHFGFENIMITGIDLRASASLRQRQAFLDYYNGNKSPTSFGIGLDGLLTMVEEKPIEIYIGAGATLSFIDSKTLSDLHLLAGLEFRPDVAILNQLGIFTEASAGLGVVNITEKFFQELTWSIGLNWHLP